MEDDLIADGDSRATQGLEVVRRRWEADCEDDQSLQSFNM